MDYDYIRIGYTIYSWVNNKWVICNDRANAINITKRYQHPIYGFANGYYYYNGKINKIKKSSYVVNVSDIDYRPELKGPYNKIFKDIFKKKTITYVNYNKNVYSTILELFKNHVDEWKFDKNNMLVKCDNLSLLLDVVIAKDFTQLNKIAQYKIKKPLIVFTNVEECKRCYITLGYNDINYALNEFSC